MAELETALREALALRWTGPVEKDVQIPASGITTSGFVFNAYNASVSPAWSKTVAHGIGRAQPENGSGASQNGIAMFSTRLLALRGLRHELEREPARRLAAIDAQIEAELDNEVAR